MEIDGLFVGGVDGCLWGIRWCLWQMDFSDCVYLYSHARRLCVHIRNLFVVRQVLLHHTSNLAVCVEVLADCALFVEWASDLLCCTSEGTVGCWLLVLASDHISSLASSLAQATNCGG